MTITLNGQTVEVSDASSYILQDFLMDRGLKPDRVAVERNGEIVARGRWHEVSLAAGDRLEIVHFVGGGCEVRSPSSCSQRSP